MEQINKIELRGLVGSVKLQEVAGKKVARITVATSAAYTEEMIDDVLTRFDRVFANCGKLDK